MAQLINKLVAGNTWDFTTAAADYPASDGWALTLYLTPRSHAHHASSISIVSVPADDGIAHRFQRTATNTASIQPGQFSFAVNAIKGAEVYTLDGTYWSGEVTVLPNPATLAVGTDTRAHAEKVLAAIEAVIEGRATSDQEEMSIAGRSLKRIPFNDLLVIRNKYSGQLASQRAADNLAAGIGAGRRVQVRLG
jgi:hypothetical protein